MYNIIVMDVRDLYRRYVSIMSVMSNVSYDFELDFKIAYGTLYEKLLFGNRVDNIEDLVRDVNTTKPDVLPNYLDPVDCDIAYRGLKELMLGIINWIRVHTPVDPIMFMEYYTPDIITQNKVVLGNRNTF